MPEGPAERCTTMKTELIQPAATIVAALISSEHIRLPNGGPRPPTSDLFVSAYRSLERAVSQIEQEDQEHSDHRPPTRG